MAICPNCMTEYEAEIDVCSVCRSRLIIASNEDQANAIDGSELLSQGLYRLLLFCFIHEEKPYEH